MAMGLARTGEETRQVQMVCLDDLVPVDDRYRGIERVVSWRAVHASAAPFYAPDGRYSVYPAVLMKLFLVAAVEGLGSMREALRLAERDISIRRFLGYGLTERLPSHATVSYAQCVRFAQSSVFEQLLCRLVERLRMWLYSALTRSITRPILSTDWSGGQFGRKDYRWRTRSRFSM